MRLQEAECSTLINEEFNKIGTVKPPAQACPGPSVVPFECKEKEREAILLLYYFIFYFSVGNDSKFTAHYLDVSY